MPRLVFPGWYPLAQASARTLGWLTSLLTIIILGYVVREWPTKLSAIAAGLVGAAIALITDSYEVVSILDPSTRRRPTAGLKRLILDILSLGVSLGGIILILFDEISFGDTSFTFGDAKVEDEVPNMVHMAHDGSGYSQVQMTQAGMWLLITVVAWRFVFAFWGCCDGARDFRRSERRWRVEMQEA